MEEGKQGDGNIGHVPLLVPEKVLQKSSSWCFDVVSLESTRSACFTKSYHRFIRGTGSVLFTDDASELLGMEGIQAQPSERSFDGDWHVRFVNRLRYFSPREVAALLSFPATFELPQTVSLRKQYELVGNSLNVLVAGELLKFLLTYGGDGDN